MLLDAGTDRQEAIALIYEASSDLTRQVGITLEICGEDSITWESTPDCGFLPPIELVARWEAGGYGNCDEGLVIAFVHQSKAKMFLGDLAGSYYGCISDNWRKFIIMTRMQTWVLTHEICHAFILSHEHSGIGLMTWFVPLFLPLTPPLIDTYLSQSDRKEVLRNKWRRFDVETVVTPQQTTNKEQEDGT
jgi:hypothetical protein